VRNPLRGFWNDDAGQDIAEFAVMLAVILVLVVGTVRLVGSNANTVFSSAAQLHPIIPPYLQSMEQLRN
jgi:Flp pilus assembly pilin Flp